MQTVKRINKSCPWFPCHKVLEDCTFCYCPFYPCANNKLGKYVYSQKLKENIWSCQDCNWIHKKDTVDDIFNMIRTNRPQGKSINLLLNSAIIILGHGSRIKKANRSMNYIIKGLKKELTTALVKPAYLQFGQPDLSKSIKALVQKKSKEIIIVPFFLFKGNHVSRDIPEAIKKEKNKYPQVKIIYTKNLSPDERMIRIIIDRIMEAKNQCR